MDVIAATSRAPWVHLYQNNDVSLTSLRHYLNCSKFFIGTIVSDTPIQKIQSGFQIQQKHIFDCTQIPIKIAIQWNRRYLILGSSIFGWVEKVLKF